MAEIRGGDLSLRSVMAQYAVGPVQVIERIQRGLIHRTFRVQSSKGAFILQGLHPDLSSDALMEDYAAVTGYLESRAFPAPRLVRTLAGKPAADVEGCRYRLISFLEGESPDSVQSARMAEEAAKMLGEFHAALNEFPHRFTHLRPLHDSPAHLAAFRSAARTHLKCPLMEEAAPLVECIDRELPKFLLPAPLPSRVVHGDPKISNILFDAASRRAVGMVDLDSCARHTSLVDLGDAIRSWCRDGPEDAASPFLIDRFAAAMEGYRRSGTPLAEVEKKLLVQACFLIPLELASRFVRDAFEDRYFGWDPARFPSRPAHNLARARGCVELFHSMLAERDKMEKIAREVWLS